MPVRVRVSNSLSFATMFRLSFGYTFFYKALDIERGRRTVQRRDSKKTEVASEAASTATVCHWCSHQFVKRKMPRLGLAHKMPRREVHLVERLQKRRPSEEQRARGLRGRDPSARVVGCRRWLSLAVRRTDSTESGLLLGSFFSRVTVYAVLSRLPRSAAFEMTDVRTTTSVWRVRMLQSAPMARPLVASEKVRR